LDVPAGNNPDLPVLAHCVAIGSATVVEQPRGIPDDVTVEVLMLVQAEDVPISFHAALERFRFAYLLANVFDDLASLKDRLLCKPADSMNWRIVEAHQIGGLRPFQAQMSRYRNGPRAVLGSQRPRFGKDVGVFSRV